MRRSCCWSSGPPTVTAVADVASLSRAYVETYPADAARVLEGLPPSDAADWLAATPVRIAAPVARQMLPLFAARAMDRLIDDSAAGLLRALGPQAGVAVLRQLPTTRADALLALLPATTAVSFRLLLGYPENTVGAWTDPHALALPPTATAADAIAAVRSSEHAHDALHVTDRDQHLVGAIALVDLLRAEPATPLRQLMQPPAVTVPAQALIRSLREHPGWTEARALPVVERGERFAGVLWQSTLELALAPDQRDGERARPSDAVSLLADGYWASVSELIEVLVSWLPDGRRPEPPRDGAAR